MYIGTIVYAAKKNLAMERYSSWKTMDDQYFVVTKLNVGARLEI
jgi:hypothetical protein